MISPQPPAVAVPFCVRNILVNDTSVTHNVAARVKVPEIPSAATGDTENPPPSAAAWMLMNAYFSPAFVRE